MERDFEICFIGREGAAAWARGHEMDWTQEMLNSDVKRKLPDDWENKMDRFFMEVSLNLGFKFDNK